MKLYIDKDKTSEIPTQGTISFGEVYVGQSKQVTLYLYNETEALLRNIKITVNDKRVRIVKFPSSLKSGETGVILLEWVPSLDVKKGLKASINIEGEEVYD